MNTNWCSRIVDNVTLNRLALPGTHDAAAWTHYPKIPSLTPGTWAQRKNITEQLNLGVRVLDLRVGYASNNLTVGITSFVGMFHGPIYLDCTLEEVLTSIKAWLDTHPQEFVVLIFQQQGKPGQRDVAAEVKAMMDRIFATQCYRAPAKMNEWPTVGALRNKVLTFSRLRSSVEGFIDVRTWLTAGDNTPGIMLDAIQGTLKIYLQDNYKNISSEQGYVSQDDDNAKKFAIVTTAARAIAHDDWKHLGINHLSYSNLRYQPWESGVGVNQRLRASTFTIKGIVMMDDADEATVDHVISHNGMWFKDHKGYVKE